MKKKSTLFFSINSLNNKRINIASFENVDNSNENFEQEFNDVFSLFEKTKYEPQPAVVNRIFDYAKKLHE